MKGRDLSAPVIARTADANWELGVLRSDQRRNKSRKLLIALLLVSITGCLAEDAQAISQVCKTAYSGTFGSRIPQLVCWYEDSPGFGAHMGGGDRGGGGGGGNVGSGNLSPTPSAKEQRTADKLEKASSCGETRGNPVVLSTGNKVELELDFVSGGEMGLYVQRAYNASWGARGVFGRYWLSNFDYTLVSSSDKKILWAQRPDGRRIKFLLDSVSGHYFEEKAEPIAYVAQQSDGTFTLFNEDNGTEKYDAQGYILERRNEQGVAWTFTYSGKYLQQVTHSSGRSVKLTWSDGLVSEITDPAGNVYRYTYTANVFGTGSGYGRLASATLPGTPETTISYHYEDSRFPSALTGKSFNGVRYSTFTYDDEGRATSTEHAGGVERYGFSYVVEATQAVTPPPAPIPPGGFSEEESRGYCEYKSGTGRICYQPRSVEKPVLMSAQAATSDTKDIPQKISITETSPLGRQTIYAYVDDRLTNTTGKETPHCPASYKEKTYDARGYEDVVSDFADNLTDFDYDAQGHLLKKVEAKSTSAERTTTYEWEVTHNRLLKEAVEGDHQTSYEYTENGRLAKQTVVDLTVHGKGRAQVTTYAYTEASNGMVSKVIVDGPLAGTDDAVTMVYSATGDLLSSRNGLGHEVIYADYNGLGFPGKITGVNGDVVEFSYDARGRELERRQQVNGVSQTTKTSYDGAGNVASVAQPDGVTRHYLYDAARRLTEEYQARTDGGGYERKRYEYNNASLVTKTEVLDTAYSGATSVIGNIDGVSHDDSWNWYADGWACSTGYAGSIDVHLYAGGAAGSGTIIGSTTANQASEAAIAAQCQSSGTAYRFHMPLSVEARQAQGGKLLYMQGISPAGNGNPTIGGSGQYTLPVAPVRGEIRSVEHDENWNYFLQGWACAVGVGNGIEVQVYTGGSAGSGTLVATGRADQAADATVANQCESGSSAHAFSIPLGFDVRTAHGGQALFVLAKSPSANVADQELTNSGANAVPGMDRNSEVVGWIGTGEMIAINPTTVTVTLRNTGNVVWGGEGTGYTYLSRGTSSASFTTTVPLSGLVAPGQEASFSWSFSAQPVNTTRYPVAAQMSTDGVNWGALATAWVIVEGVGGCDGTRCTQPASIHTTDQAQGEAQ